MATTTNYGWTTPDDTALVKDGASAIRTLGSSVDTTTKALNPSTTLGDIEYRSSTANTNTRLAIGSTGNVLTVAGGVPTWAAPAGGGKVLQVVQATTATTTTISSATFTDTGLTASITPSATSSKILVIFTQTSDTSRNSPDAGSGLRLLRNSTTIFDPAPNGYETQYIYGQTIGSSGTNIKHLLSGSYLDSPSTTSSTTYKTQARIQTATSASAVTLNNAISSIILMEIGA